MRAWIIFFLTSLPILAEAAQPLDKVVAIINDSVITASELNRDLEVAKQELIAKHMQLPTAQVLRKQVLQHLIDVDLQLQLAKKNDLSVDDIELNEAIAKIAENNHLSLERLREEIVKQGLSWEAYRKKLRIEVLLSHIQQKAVGQDIKISSQQIDDYLKTFKHDEKTQQQTYHLLNIVIPLPEAPSTEQVIKAKAKAHIVLAKIKQGGDFSKLALAESSGEYALEGGDLGERHVAELPEIFAELVMGMNVGEVAGPVRAGNGFQLIKLIAVGGTNMHHELMKTHVRHILLKQDINMTADEALRQVNNLYQQLRAGKDFSSMAKQHSLDSVSAAQGGDLGWVSAEELVPAFANAMNALPLHTVSKPVKSPFGWHLIEVLERKSIDDSEAFKRAQVRQFLHLRKFNEAVQNWQQHLHTDAYIKIVDQSLL